MSQIQSDSKIKIMVLGVCGMLGHKVFEVLSKEARYDVWGTANDFAKYKEYFPKDLTKKVIDDIWADKLNTVEQVIEKVSPTVIINCIGVIKQNPQSNVLNLMYQLNGLFPQQLAMIAEKIGARVVTIATDCVFDGKKETPYVESDIPTSYDAYGMSKYLGELHYGNHLTLRTSIIGHELNSNLSLLDWFLSDERTEIPGYTKAIFSGLTTLEFAKFLAKYVIEDNKLTGLYHLSVNPISKLDLLNLIGKQYGKKVTMVPEDKVSINRALDSTILREEIGYQIPDWEKLIYDMHEDYLTSSLYLIKRKTNGKTKLI